MSSCKRHDHSPGRTPWHLSSWFLYPVMLKCSCAPPDVDLERQCLQVQIYTWTLSDFWYLYKMKGKSPEKWSASQYRSWSTWNASDIQAPKVLCILVAFSEHVMFLMLHAKSKTHNALQYLLELIYTLTFKHYLKHDFHNWPVFVNRSLFFTFILLIVWSGYDESRKREEQKKQEVESFIISF